MKNKGAIYYDGLCVACSTEINHYRQLPGAEAFDFLDITAPQFKPEANGVDPVEVHKVMHVRDSSGVLHKGVDAFRAIWRELPRYQFLYRWSDRKPVRAMLQVAYNTFVKIRPYLPRRKADCSNSPYCEVSK